MAASSTGDGSTVAAAKAAPTCLFFGHGGVKEVPQPWRHGGPKGGGGKKGKPQPRRHSGNRLYWDEADDKGGAAKGGKQ